MAANGPNILTLVSDKVQYFSNTTNIWLYLLRVNRQDAATKELVVQIFDVIDGTTTSAQLDVAEQIIREIAFNYQPKLFAVNEGEDFCLQIDLEVGRDFTGYMLTARTADTLTLISENNIAGDSYANAPTQDINCPDLSLTPGDYYHCVALLEHPSGGIASGDAATKLTDFYLIVLPTIDV